MYLRVTLSLTDGTRCIWIFTFYGILLGLASGTIGSLTISVYFRYLDYKDAEEIKQDPQAYARRMKHLLKIVVIGFAVIVFTLICGAVYYSWKEILSEFVLISLVLSDFFVKILC